MSKNKSRETKYEVSPEFYLKILKGGYWTIFGGSLNILNHFKVILPKQL